MHAEFLHWYTENVSLCARKFAGEEKNAIPLALSGEEGRGSPLPSDC